MLTMDVRNVCVLSYGQGFTLWHYRDQDAPIRAMAGDGFFSSMARMVARGDVIFLHAADGAGVAVVSAVSEPSDTVSVRLMTTADFGKD